MARELQFEESERVERNDGEPALLIDVDGFEGPLDLLLELARRQKVDLHRISILALAEQYLAYIEEARRLRLELAADYLVMAAWLAYLKSRLLLPDPPKGDEPTIEELALALALRLQRLEVIREASQLLSERNRLGRDIFARGAPERIRMSTSVEWDVTLYDLLSAYAQQREKNFNTRVTLHKRRVWSLNDAREALERLIGFTGEWVSLDEHLLRYLADPMMRPTVMASTLSATLEFAREGKVALHQDSPFGPLWIRPKAIDEG